MIVGVPKEVKDNEYRVALTPAGVRELVAKGHTVLIERGAGEGSAFEDGAYAGAGATLAKTPAELFERSALVLKVKEPQPSEVSLLRPGQVLFAFLHLAPDQELTRALVESGAVCIAYETVELDDGSLPLLAPMSEVAGRMAVQVGAEYLLKPMGGRGMLMGGVPGVPPACVTVLGAGVVGANAVSVAVGMGADVTVLDVDLAQLRQLDALWGNRVRTLYSMRHTIESAVYSSDLVIGAVLVHGGRAPWLVTRDMLGHMRRGSVIVDVAVDQGGCVETIRPTTHSDPTYFVDGVLHYGVANMPGAVPHTSTTALANATLRYVMAIADKGWEAAVMGDASLAAGVNVANGRVTYGRVAEAHGLAHTSVTDIIG